MQLELHGNKVFFPIFMENGRSYQKSAGLPLRSLTESEFERGVAC